MGTDRALALLVKMFPPLPKSYKRAYPFRLASPSYIYPDQILPNVRMLAPFLDEIELLLFESHPESSLPSKDEIRQLCRLAEETHITYNVHLPTDISISHPDSYKRFQGVDVIKRVMDLTCPLQPSTYTLHLPFEEPFSRVEQVKRWQEYTYASMELIVGKGISGKHISIETLMYPFEWAGNIVDALDLSVCMDIGHMILQGVDIESIYDTYGEKTTVIHLHGVRDGRDHLSLDKLSGSFLDPVMNILGSFTGVVSLEVFSYENLKASLSFLEKCWHNAHRPV